MKLLLKDFLSFGLSKTTIIKIQKKSMSITVKHHSLVNKKIDVMKAKPIRA